MLTGVHSEQEKCSLRYAKGTVYGKDITTVTVWNSAARGFECRYRSRQLEERESLETYAVLLSDTTVISTNRSKHESGH